MKKHKVKILIATPILLPLFCWLFYQWYWWNLKLGLAIGQTIENM
jgi:hypothetical protein